jgi:3-oxoacyl-[acyl-carrier protein] reductase
VSLTAVITGASGGLGGYLAQRLAVDCDVIGTYNTRKPTASGTHYPLDVQRQNDVADFVARVRPKLSRVVLVNLAGISVDGMGHKMDETTWDRVIDTNLKGAFLMSRMLLPVMREQGWGRIVNISSVVGQCGIAGTAAYAASKGGLLSLTRTSG